MTPDEQVKIYNKGFKEGETHSQPSPESNKRLKDVETYLSSIGKDFAVFTQKTDDYHLRQDEKLDAIIIKVDYTNGKVRKMTIALTAVAAFSVGLGLVEGKALLSLII